MAERPYGLFVGLATLDSAYRVAALPAANAKVTALGQELAAGGPAANAAVTLAGLGGRAVLFTALGQHPLARHAVTELAEQRVEVHDATPRRESPPPVSSIYVVDGTGDRSVVSVNGGGVEPRPPAELRAAVAKAGVLLVDGHYPTLALPAARFAREHRVPVVLDGGSWKPVLEELLPLVDVAICSADLRAPGATSSVESVAAMRRRGVPAVAVTRGGAPIWWWSPAGSGEVPVSDIQVKDTLGAGDVFHGAFCHALLAAPGIAFPRALDHAAKVAGVRCGVPGLRAWLASGALRELAGAVSREGRA